MIPELTVIIPTLNELPNVSILVDRLEIALKGIEWEAVFVDDDSTDGTLEMLQQLARRNERVRYIRRVGRRGLSSACLEGMAASSAPWMAVMDADLQHEEGLLPEMLEKLRSGHFDLVIGSRYKGASVSDEWSPIRRRLSRMGIWLGQIILRTHISDPLSGFFMLSRELFERVIHRVSGKGFKILLDILASVGGNLRHVELPFVFHPRRFGRSKLDTLVIWEYALLLLDKTAGRIIPTRFLMFALIGTLGGIMHLGILWIALNPMSFDFIVAQSVATGVAISMNFFLNNIFTYRDERLRGLSIVRGLLFFYLVCSLGAFVNVRLALLLYEHQIEWWFAGLLGAVVGAVWNYAVSSVFVWPKKRLSF
jgi:dolichol-phosphate mannosyltransferase